MTQKALKNSTTGPADMEEFLATVPADLDPYALRSGDLAGTAAVTKVAGMLGFPISNSPVDNDLLKFNASGPNFYFSAPSAETVYQPAPTPLPNIAVGATATADSQLSGSYPPINAIDGNNALTTQWAAANVSGPHWLQVDFGHLCRISSYKIFTNPSPFTITAWNFQSWDVGSASWITQDTVSANAATTLTRTMTSFDTTKVRIYITNPGTGDNTARLYELEIYGYALISSGHTGVNAAYIQSVPIDTVAPTGTNNIFTYDPVSGLIKWLPGAGGGGGGTTINSGAAFPASPTEGMLFVRTDLTPYGLYLYQTSTWHLIGDGVGSGSGVGFVGARIRSSAAQSIPQATTTYLTFDTVDFDPQGFYSSGVPTRLTVPAGQAGKYVISASFRMGNSSNVAQAGIQINGTDFAALNNLVPPSGYNVIHNMTSPVLQLNAGDYITLFLYQTSGTSVLTTVEARESPVLSMYRVDTAGGTTINSGTSFPTGPAEGDLFIRTDLTPYGLHLYHSGAWHLAGDGTPISSGTAFPASPVEGSLFIRTDLTPYGLHLYHSGAWNLLGDGGGTGGSSSSGGSSSALSNVALTATATADSINGTGNEAINAINGNTTDINFQWISSNTAPPHWIELDLLTTTRIVQWQVYFQSGQWPAQAFVLQRWDVPTSAWVDVDPVTGNSAAALSRNVTPFDAQKVRMYVTVPTQPGTGDNRVRLVELQIYGYPQGLRSGTDSVAYNYSLVSAGILPTADSSLSSSYLAVRATDGLGLTDGSSRWVSANVNTPHWLTLDFGATVPIGQWKVYHQADAADYVTKTFKLQYSSDNTTWLDADSVTNNTAVVTNRYLTAPLSARYWRFYFTVPNQGTGAAAGDFSTRIWEVQLYQAVPASNIGAAAFTGARVFMTTRPTIASGVTPMLSWDTKDYDTGGFWTSTLPTRLTIPASLTGHYLLEAQVAWPDNSAGQRTLHIIKNGVTANPLATESIAPGSRIQAMRVVSVDNLVAGDYLELQVFQDSGSGLTLVSSSNLVTDFSLTLQSGGGGSTDPEMARLTMSGNGSFASGGRSVVFDTRDQDSSTMIDPAALDRITIRRGGVYAISGALEWTDSASTVHQLTLYKNNFGLASVIGTNPGGAWYQNASTLAYLVAGDVIQLSATSSNASTITHTQIISNLAVVSMDRGVARPVFTGASIFRSTAQSIPVTLNTAISFDQASYDSDGYYSAANPTRLTVPAGKSGYYRVTGGLRFTSHSSGGRREVALRLNGAATNLMETESHAGADTYTGLNPTIALYLTQGDYIELLAYQGASAALNTYTVEPPFLQLELINSTSALAAGAVQLQAAYPASGQLGNARVTGTLGADTRIDLGTVPILEWGNTFPAAPVDGQRYWHSLYRSWFIYNAADAKWRQEGPGIFGSSFPTVTAGDNTVAPNIEVKRIDRSNEIYFWNGAYWLTVRNYPVALSAKLGISPTNSVTGTTNAVNQGTHPDGSSDVYITTIVTQLYPTGTNNSTNFWNAQFTTRNTGVVVTNTYTGNTAAGASSVIIPIVIPVNAVVTRANYADVVQNVTTTGSPGGVNFFPAIMNCRLVG